MARQKISLKQLAVDKNNTSIVIAVGFAAFIVIFCLVASNSLIKQSSYQSGVISDKKKALKQLKTNVTEVEKLKTSYEVFASEQQNVLGGSSTGTGDRDGDNPRLVLDALPSKYDFPAVTTSLEKVFKQYKIENISGKDDEVAQAAQAASASPSAIDMPFSIEIAAAPTSAKQILSTFEKSIRPFQVQKVAFKSDEGEFTMTVDAKTYFQPSKKFDVKKDIKK